MTTLAAFKGSHAGDTVVVCGCGESLHQLVDPHRFVTIGVNDVGRLFDPRYLVVVNRRAQFASDRFRYVEQSRAECVFTQLRLDIPHPRVVNFRLGRYGGTTFTEPDVLHYTQNSPYVAVCLAVQMGAARVGLIGVDFTERHFFGATGVHPLARRCREIDDEYRRLRTALEGIGVEIVNLSTSSRLSSLPKMSWRDFATPRTPRRAAPGLRIASYSTTPVAGVAAILARCIEARTPHTARCVWPDRSYRNGVTFDGDIEWNRRPDEAAHAIEEADIVVVHNGKTERRHEPLLRGKRIVTMAHNYMWNVDRQFVSAGQPGVVVGQYQATLAEFASWRVVPNPIPSWEPAFSPGAKAATITVCYTPSGRHERYPPTHRLFWHAKGYDTTMRVLDRLQRRYAIDLAVVGANQVSHAQSLEMKRRAHIVIDECVTGSYHRNSLEGLAAGCVVVNGMGLLAGVEDVFRRCAPDTRRVPFVFTPLEDLERQLAGLIEQGAGVLEDAGRRNREWVEQHWDFATQWDRFWAPVVEAPRAPRAAVSFAAPVHEPAEIAAAGQQRCTRPDAPRRGVSVVIPHGGESRLPLLKAALAMLRQRRDVGEVIVVEMGPSRFAEAAARRWSAKYMFLEHAGDFERARALNAGSAVAEFDLVLWHDNDIMTAPDFVSRASMELRRRRLDYLVPYTAVRYLSEDDSAAVIAGARDPAECAPVNMMWSGGRRPSCSGGLGLVTRRFLERAGGMVEGFRGWGGEDNAWLHKVARFGHSAPTTRHDQHIYHLYHDGSGGYSTARASDHRHYRDNLALLRQVRSTGNPQQFSKDFAAPLRVGAPVDTTGQARPEANAGAAGPSTVWVYWEGPCPAWIRECRRTIARHAPGVRFLGRDEFDRLRDRDRDIDLMRLQVAGRADYIRAFLLARFGGLWIDADCLAMQSLAPILERVREHDFVAHRERSGLVSNGFIGARADSPVAAAYYERVCRVLRSRRPLGWTSLGSQPLTELLEAPGTSWHELPCERVQPICWSEPAAFLARGSAAQHDASHDRQAICYMLSNTEIAKRPGAAASLLDPDTLFMHLVRVSLGMPASAPGADYERIFADKVELYRGYRDESLSGPGSTLAQTREVRERLPLVLQHLGVRALVDAPCGDFHWLQNVDLGIDLYTGVDVLGEVVAENVRRHGSARRQFFRLDITRDHIPAGDAVLCRDALVHMPFDDAFRALRNFRASGARWLIATTFSGPRPNADVVPGAWRPLNLTCPPFAFPPPVTTIVEKCTEAAGAFADKSLGVWRLQDLAL